MCNNIYIAILKTDDAYSFACAAEVLYRTGQNKTKYTIFRNKEAVHAHTDWPHEKVADTILSYLWLYECPIALVESDSLDVQFFIGHLNLWQNDIKFDLFLTEEDC